MKGNRRTVALPGFPVEFGGIGKLHAAFLNESRTRRRVQRSEAGNPGTLGMTKESFDCQGKWLLAIRRFSNPIWTGLRLNSSEHKTDAEIAKMIMAGSGIQITASEITENYVLHEGRHLAESC